VDVLDDVLSLQAADVSKVLNVPENACHILQQVCFPQNNKTVYEKDRCEKLQRAKRRLERNMR
jgi:hypothetical protein